MYFCLRFPKYGLKSRSGQKFVDFPCFRTLSSTGRSLGSNQLHIQFTGQTSAVCRKRSKEKEIGKGGTYKIDLRRLRRNVQTLKRSGDKTKQMFKHLRSTWKVHLRKLWQHGENIPGEMFRDHGIVLTRPIFTFGKNILRQALLLRATHFSPEFCLFAEAEN